MPKEEHLKQQQRKEKMKYEAEAVLEGLVYWRSGKAAKTSEKTVSEELASKIVTRNREKKCSREEQRKIASTV